MTAKHKPLKITFDSNTREKLDRIAVDTGRSMAHIIREAVGNYYKMAYDKQPTCATGTPCLVAALHLQVHQAAPLGTAVPAAPASTSAPHFAKLAS